MVSFLAPTQTQEIIDFINEKRPNAVNVDDEQAAILSIVENVDLFVEDQKTLNVVVALILEQIDKSVLVSAFISSIEKSNQKLQLLLLGDLFNALDRFDPARYDVLVSILKVSKSLDNLSALIPSLAELDSWVIDWNCFPEQIMELYTMLAEYYYGVDDQLCYQFSLELLKMDEGPMEQHVKKVCQLLVNIPTNFDFALVYSLPAIEKAGGKLSQLLDIFVNKGLSDYQQFAKENALFIKDLGIDLEKGLHKMKLLTLLSFALENIEQSVEYEKCSKQLNIDVEELVYLAIDAIRFGLLEAKLDDIKQTFTPIKASKRKYDAETWANLNNEVSQLQQNMEEILAVVSEMNANSNNTK